MQTTLNNPMRFIAFVLLLVLVHTTGEWAMCSAQNMRRVGYYLDTLCSPTFFGRGYTKNGDSLASDYLAGEFSSIGLQPVEGSYFQPFDLDVMVFPDSIGLQADEQVLELGKEFLAMPYSKPGAGEAKVLRIKGQLSDSLVQEHLQNENLEGKALVAPHGFFNEVFKAEEALRKKVFSAEVWIALKNGDPTGLMAQYQMSPPWFELSAYAWPEGTQEVKYQLPVELREGYQSRNVWGFLEGSGEGDSLLLITAHYDHLGGMGPEVYFPGANDNASGVAMLLELAHWAKDQQENLPQDMLFVLFSGEEVGLSGSKYASAHFPFPLEQIQFLLNIDLMSTGDKGITAVNAPCCPAVYKRLAQLNDSLELLPRVRKRAQAPNSDHFYFNQKGVPGFFIYTEGERKTYYHHVQDRPDSLPLSRFEEVFELFTNFILSF